MDGGRNAIGTFGEHREYSVVNEVVNQDDSTFGAANEVGDVGPCVPYAAGRKDGFRKKFWRVFFHFFKDGIDLFVCFNLLFLKVGNSHQDVCVLDKEPTHCDKGIYDSDAGINGLFAG